MVDCLIQHMLSTKRAGTATLGKKKEEPRQSRPGASIINTVMINNREATSTKGVRAILEQITGHKYSRDAVYRLYVDGKIEGERSDVANFYYIDSVRQAAQKLILPDKKRRAGRGSKVKTYPQAVRDEAHLLRQQGLSNRAIAMQLKVSYQTINNWLRDGK